MKETNMKHTIHVLSNSQSEAYIMVLNRKSNLDTIVNEVYANSVHFQKKNPLRCRFVVDNLNDMELEHFEVTDELATHKDVLAFREKVIAQYSADGFIFVDEKHYDMMDSDANDNFAFINSAMNMAEAIKSFGKEALIKGRKNMTVREFLNTFAV